MGRHNRKDVKFCTVLISTSHTNGWTGNASAPAFVPRNTGGLVERGRGGGFGGGGYGSYGGRGGAPYSNGSSGGGGATPGYGIWRDGKHIVGGRAPRMEKELYGEADDSLKQHSGINFDKYDDIPVEATGAGVPEPVNEFTNPPLDPVLLENISYARYVNPTPVQKYSIPIVANKRDLMACAQVRFVFSRLIYVFTFSVDWFRQNGWFLIPYSIGLFHEWT